MNPPCINPTDQDKYRQQYLANLALQASNNEKNLQANLIFRKTGETPNQLTDYRTTTERAADLEGLKTDIRSFFSSNGFLNSTNANELVQQLNEGELKFVFEWKQLILSELKGQNLPMDFVLVFLRRLIRKTLQSAGVEYGLQQETGEAILMSSQQILYNMVNRQDLAELARVLREIQAVLPEDKNLIFLVLDEMQQIQDRLPTPEFYRRLNEIDPASRMDIYQALNAALQDAPTRGDIAEAIRSLVLMRDTQGGESQVLQTLASDFARLRETMEGVQALLKARSGGGRRFVEPEETPKKEEPPSPSPKKAPAKTLGDFLNDSIERFETLLESAKDKLAKAMERKAPQQTINALQNDIEEIKKQLDSRKFELAHSTPAELAQPNKRKGYGLKGKGLTAVATPRKFVDRIEGTYEKPKSYVQFGRYVINKHKLDDGILMLKTPSGKAVAEMPTQRVSTKLTGILKNLVKGGTADIDQIVGLGLGDKQILHKLISKAHYEKCAVPNPNKDEEDKEKDRFDILKGEIMAGNDNMKLVKEFKALVMKFLHEGRLPRREAQEILMDLTAAGF